MLQYWIIASVNKLVQIYLLLLIIRAVLSWVDLFNPLWRPNNPALIRVLNFIYRVTDPPLRLASRYIKPVRIGGMALDIGFLVVFLVIYLLVDVLNRFQFSYWHSSQLLGL